MRRSHLIVVSLFLSMSSAVFADACPQPPYRLGMDVDGFLRKTERGIVQSAGSSIGALIAGTGTTLTDVAYLEYKLARQRVGSTNRPDDDHFNAMRQFYDQEATVAVVSDRLSLLGRSRASGAVQLIEQNRASQFSRLKDLLRGRPADFNTISSSFKRAWSECK